MSTPVPMPDCFSSEVLYVWQSVPDHLKAGLARYFNDRIAPGQFLLHVLANDFTQAVVRADSAASIGDLRILAYIVMYAPPASVGSMEKIAAWVSGVRL